MEDSSDKQAKKQKVSFLGTHKPVFNVVVSFWTNALPNWGIFLKAVCRSSLIPGCCAMKRYVGTLCFSCVKSFMIMVRLNAKKTLPHVDADVESNAKIRKTTSV